MITGGQQTASRVPADRKPRRSFMKPGEFAVLRQVVIRATQERVAEQLVDPDTGQPVTRNCLSAWERGARPVPLWAARRVRDLAEAARSYDRRFPRPHLPVSSTV